MSEALIGDLRRLLEALLKPSIQLEFGALILCALLAWWMARAVARSLPGRPQGDSILFGQRIVDGVLFPLLLLCLAYLARFLLHRWSSVAVFGIAMPVIISLLCIRLGVKVLQAAFQDSPWMRLLERSISWLAWGALVLWLTGPLPLIMEELDQITWKMGDSVLSVRKLIEGALTAGVVLIVALWISSIIESRLLRSASGGELSLRLAVSNATRVLLMFIGLMLALSAVGIDLTALSVLGGAIGVGVGFGLQKLAANYLSGFVILAERSMRIGDNVRVDNFEGRISRINARYTVIRSVTGRESIVPNEMLITSRVENLSLADTRVWQSTVVSVAYDSDVSRVMRLLEEAALAEPRVLRDPEPAIALSNFGADGLEFTVGYWIADPENGTLNLKSQVNLAILRLLRENQIEIPYPQRVVHTRPG